MPLRSDHLRLGLAVSALLACAPHRGSSPPPEPATAPEPAAAGGHFTPEDAAGAVADASASAGARLPERERPQPRRREPKISATPITGDTAVDVGHGRSLRIATDGEIRLGDVLLFPNGGIASPKFYERARIGDDTIVVVGFGFDTAPDDPGYVVAARIDGHADKARWASWINAQRIDGGADTDWQLVVAEDRVVLMQDERVMALDATTGAQAWVFSAVDPRVSDGYLGGVPITRTTLRMIGLATKAHRVIVDAEADPDRSPITVELDLAAGKRVYVDHPRAATPVRPLFAFNKVSAPWHGYDDPPTPQPDPPPAGFDGLSVGHAALLWSTKTGHGIIVNPTRDASADIVDAARKARWTDAAGKQAPITWTLVIDTAAAASAMNDEGKRPPTRTRTQRADEVRFDYTNGFGTMQTGEVVALDAVATALGATAVRSYAELPASRHGVDFVRVPGQLPELRVAWGPIHFADDPGTHVLVFVRAM